MDQHSQAATGQENVPTAAATQLASEARPRLNKLAVSGFTSLFISVIEGVCAFLVALKGSALFVGLTGLMSAATSSWFHQDRIRIPLMLLAAGIALANTYMLWNFFRLRRSPAARWRIQPLSQAEKRRVALVITATVLTFFFLVAELWGHRVLMQ